MTLLKLAMHGLWLNYSIATFSTASPFLPGGVGSSDDKLLTKFKFGTQLRDQLRLGERRGLRKIPIGGVRPWEKWRLSILHLLDVGAFF